MGLSIFLSRLATYHTQAAETRCDFDKFDESLRQENKVEVIQWEKELTAWAVDKSLPDPYRMPKSSKDSCLCVDY